MKAVAVVLSVLLLAACHSKDDAPPPVDTPKAGRAETQSIRNTQAIGYDGKAIADKVDDALNKNDQTVKNAEKASQEQPEPPQ